MRYPIIRQHDASDCGPTCLAMISAFYGRRQSIAILRERAGTSTQGTSLAGLIQAAAEIGFRSRAVRAHPEALSEIPLPVIAHWREDGRNHFVVLYRRGRKHLDLGDPAVGRRRLSHSEFGTYWTGTLLLLEATPQLHSLETAPVATLWDLIRIHRRVFLDALMAATLVTLLALSSSFFVQVLVDFIIPTGGRSTLDWLAIGMLLVLGARSSFQLIRGYLMAHLARRIDAEVVIAYHHHVLDLPLTFFSTRHTGEIASRLHDAIRIRNAVGGTMLSVVVDSTTVFVTAGAMLWLDWQLALPALGVLPLLGVTLALLTPGLRTAQQAALERGARFEAHTVEAITAIQSLRCARAEGWMKRRGEYRFAEVLQSAFTSEVYGVWHSTAATLLAGTGALALLWAGGHAVLDDRLSLGSLMALYTLFGMVIGPVERLSGANQALQEALVAGHRVGEVLALPASTDTNPASAMDRTIMGQIEFDEVRFRYGSRPPVIERFSERIPAGECCRISGRSGSGKSTLVRLLARLYEPESGRILIDGVDVREYSMECLRKQVTYLSQEAALLSASVADNIRLGNPAATSEQIRNAAAAAGAHDFIAAAPGGYQSLVGERGLSLSGGERQRLVLARAILNDPAILILDEPTNHLDPPSVRAVLAVLASRRARGRTTLLISHDALPSDRTIRIDA